MDGDAGFDALPENAKAGTCVHLLVLMIVPLIINPFLKIMRISQGHLKKMIPVLVFGHQLSNLLYLALLP